MVTKHYLNGTLEVFDGVTINIVVRTNGLLQLVADDHTWALGGRATSEQHNTGSGIRIGRLKKSNSHTESNASAPKRALVIRHRPRVACEGFENAGQLELALLDRHQESGSAEGGLGHGLTWAGRSAVLGGEA